MRGEDGHLLTVGCNGRSCGQDAAKDERPRLRSIRQPDDLGAAQDEDRRSVKKTSAKLTISALRGTARR
ncbi:MAG: hypothetical protein HC872_08950 [Gammaproteobacteria bacterium]|nr:hypothetical protein [Gammaproteobacteria bacterium]